jgi:hypothetical protein
MRNKMNFDFAEKVKRFNELIKMLTEKLTEWKTSKLRILLTKSLAPGNW